MSATQRQATIDQAYQIRAADLRIQAAQADATLKAMSLNEMLAWFGGDLAAGQGPAGFRTAVASIKRWHELNERNGE